MSSTMTLTTPILPPPRLSAIPCCPNCGTDLSLTFTGAASSSSSPNNSDATLLQAAQAQIDDMQAQIRLLNAKATAAVDRWADYEDELSKLRKELNTAAAAANKDPPRRESLPQTPTLTTTMTPTSPRGSPSMGFAAAATNRISALLSRKSTPNLKAMPSAHSQSYSASNLLPTPPPSGGHHQTSYSTSALLTPNSPANNKNSLYTPASTAPSTTEDLIEALTREQRLRLAAEAKVNDTSREVEELSVSLFEEANEMVATERRERARLEERVGELEKRDRQKKMRLERLEGAVGRIERVRNLLDGKDVDVQT
ncbi:hypothetical protein N0V82_006177 [Gnomoniopsis sp. IMI 355080]|nr:hypothetical protein N0V82_006177 [Gnomoniopsis sp. IMI 355080]